MVWYLIRMGGITTLIIFCIFYPFLPGKHDNLAMPLSTVVQLFSVAGLFLVPIGILWLVYEVRKQTQKSKNFSITDKGYYFAMVAMILFSLFAILISLITFWGISMSLGLFTCLLWLFAVSKWMPKLKLLRHAEMGHFNPTPLYLTFIPVTVLLFQIKLAAPATEFSRNYAIAQSAELIHAIEEHHVVNGRYPNSLLAVWEDYYPSVTGIKQFYYAPNGEAYNLFFEQPKLLLDNVGTREFVAYNKLDEHVIPSHASWVLVWTPEELEAQQGWYAAYDTSSSHWKCFWFD